MPTSDPLAILRYLDVVVVVLAAPFVILTGAPLVGYLAGAAGWIVMRLAGERIQRSAAGRDARAAVGMNLAVVLGRAWLLGIVIVVTGLVAEREDGLMAALVALVAFTIYLATSLILRPIERTSGK